MKHKTWTELVPPEKGISAARRERLHWQLDAILNASERIKRQIQEGVDGNTLGESKYSLCRQAAEFIAGAIGDEARIDRDEHIGTDQHFLVDNLTLWFPVLAAPGRGLRLWAAAIDEISRMSFGDEPEIFAIAPRKRGSHPRPAKIHRCRLSAIEWAEFLQQRDVPPATYQAEIAEAFGERWDTIRHWKKSCQSFFGKSIVSEQLDSARNGWWPFLEFPNYVDSLARSGSEYRSVLWKNENLG